MAHAPDLGDRHRGERESVLAALGIGGQQELVLRALLAAPQSTVAELAAATGLDADDVAAMSGRLEELGFLTLARDQCPTQLIPARPDVAVDLLVARRKAELDRVSAAARLLVEDMQVPVQQRPDALLEVVVGREAISARFAQLLDRATSTLLVLDTPPYAAPAGSSDQQVRGLLSEGVTVRGIYSPESMSLPGALDEALSATAAGEQSRVHPAVPMKLAVVDGSVAILPLSTDNLIEGALVVRRCALLDALVRMFELLWEDAVPVHPPEDGLYDARLMTLLSAGLKDEAIARQLQVSPRTIARRIAELMDRLGARTRFQAGLHARRAYFAAGRERGTPPRSTP